MKIERELGFGEARMHLFHLLCHGTTQGALHLRLAGEYNENSIMTAVSSLLRALPDLSLAISKVDGHYHYVRPQQALDVSDYLNIYRSEKSDENAWQEDIRKANNDLLDASIQLWRLDVFPKTDALFDLVLVTHHALMDANGSEYLLDSLLKLVSGTPVESVFKQVSTGNPIFPSLEQDAITSCSWDKFLDVQSDAKKALAHVQLENHVESAVLTDRETVVQFHKINKQTVDLLNRICTVQNVSMNSLLSALFIYAVANNSRRKEFALATAMAMRQFCPNVEDNSMGSYLSVAATSHSVSNLAIESYIELAKQHKEKTYEAFLRVARWVPESYPEDAIEKMINGIVDSTVFSNDLGLTYADSGLKRKYGEIELKHQYVVARRQAGNVSAIMHGLHSNGEIFLTMSHVTPLQDSKWATNVLNQFKSDIPDLISHYG